MSEKEQKLIRSLRARLGHKTRKIESQDRELERTTEKLNFLKGISTEEEIKEMEKNCDSMGGMSLDQWHKIAGMGVGNVFDGDGAFE